MLLSFRRTRTIVGTVVASVLILIGMWMERFLIIIPTLTHPRLPVDLPFTIGTYQPTSAEWAIMAASAAAIALLYLIFLKLFPIVPVWEIREEREQEREERERKEKESRQPLGPEVSPKSLPAR
jgi:Ni/Fe-hydrogenase subunit HybB-like protein